MEDVLVWKKRREKSEKDRGREGGMLTWCIRRCFVPQDRRRSVSEQHRWRSTYLSRAHVGKCIQAGTGIVREVWCKEV